MAATPTGGGYWLAASDGRVFAFGDAVTRQSDGGQTVPRTAGTPGPGAPIVSIAASPAGQGYWLAARDGTVVAVDAPFRGSVPGGADGHRVVRIRATETGEGYYVAREDGGLYTFGDADQRRQRPGRAGGRTVVDVALRPLRPRRPTRPA